MDYSVILELLEEIEKTWDKIINHFQTEELEVMPLPKSLMNFYKNKRNNLKEVSSLFFLTEMDNKKRQECFDLLCKSYMLLDSKFRSSHVRYHSDLEKLIKELQMDCIQLSNFGFRLSSFLTLSDENVDLYLVHTERRMEFFIYLHGTNICVGQINYENNCSDDFRKFWGDVSYDVDEQYRGNGYAGKALRVMAKYLYNNKNIDSLYINAHTDNLASIKTIEKFGGELYLDERGISCYRCDLTNILDKDKIDMGQSRK